jgi:hypothetical protein
MGVWGAGKGNKVKKMKKLKLAVQGRRQTSRRLVGNPQS